MVTKTTLNRILIDRLKIIAPHEYERAVVLTTPRITDWDQIPLIVNYCEENGYPVNNENIPLILCVVYSLTAPYKLYYREIKLPLGLRDCISDAFGFVNPEMCNYFSEISRTYAKGKNWIVKYEALVEGYLEQMGNGE